MNKSLKVLKVILGILGASLYMVLIFTFVKQTTNYIYGKYFEAHYKDGDYTINENILLNGNYFESYIVYYNNGNVEFKNKKYEEALKDYKNALECGGIPRKRECDIHINMALCHIRMLPDDYEKYENIDDSIETLRTAQKELFVDNCANEDKEGHSETAEQLSEEIEEEIKRLEELKKQEEEEMSQEEKEEREKREQQKEEDKENKQDGEDGQPSQEELEQNKKEQDDRETLEQISQEAREEQQSDLERYREQDAEQDREGISDSERDLENIW